MSNVAITQGSGTEIATDLVAGNNYQIVKLDIGGVGSSVPLVGDAVHGIPVNITQSTATLLVDTELPAAQGLTDGAPNPSAPIVGSYLHTWDGTFWNRVKGDVTNGLLVNVSQVLGNVSADTELPSPLALNDGTANPTVPSIGNFNHIYNGTQWNRKRGVTGADDNTSVGIEASGQYTYNGANWDKRRGNYQVELLNGAYAATQTSPLQTSYNTRGVILYLSIEAMPASGDTLQPVVEMVDPVGGTSIAQLTNFPVTAPGNLSGAPIAYAYIIYPGVNGASFPAYNAGTSTNVVYAQPIPLPRTWRVRVIHSGSSSWGYTLGASFIV